MDVAATRVPGAFVFTPVVHDDDRGAFAEWYRADVVEKAVGHRLALAQANHSVSRAGVLRGIHYALVPPGQAKYVYCPRGRVVDFVVDLREGSPTFGAWDFVVLDDSARRGLYVAEGLGHAFVATSDDASVTYLCSTPYDPAREFTISPFDPALGIDWGVASPLLSPRDVSAPSVAEARAAGHLPSYAECVAWYGSLS